MGLRLSSLVPSLLLLPALALAQADTVTGTVRRISRGLSAFVSVENVGDVKYQVNYSGGIVSLGLPRTVRVGVRAGRE